MEAQKEVELRQIWIYPIASMHGLQVQEAVVKGPRFQWDREWGLFDVDKQEAVAGKNCTLLYHFKISFEAEILKVTHPSSEAPLLIDTTQHPQNREDAEIMTLYGTKKGASEGEAAS